MFDRHILNKQDTILTLLGKLNTERILSKSKISSLEEVEFKVFSQWGEDGIIQYLINKIDVPNKVFIEFGVENYHESNTRFLLINNQWEGLLIESNKEHVNYIKSCDIYWKYNLTSVNSFITINNINTIIKNNLNISDIGLLSIDIDGNDYWIWKAIKVINPRIVICEYNNFFGCSHSITIPYDENFNRSDAHYSNLYYGASLPALCELAEEKGYDFIGSNSAGNNAFFIRKDVNKLFDRLSPEEGYHEATFKESRNVDGKLNFIQHEETLKEISDLEVFCISENKNMSIKQLFNI